MKFVCMCHFNKIVEKYFIKKTSSKMSYILSAQKPSLDCALAVTLKTLSSAADKGFSVGQ